MATEKNPRRDFVNTIIESMKGRDNAWQKTWENMAEVGAPHNPVTGTQYKGINFLSLAIEQTKLKTQDPRWCTFDQAVEAGFKIPKATKSSHAHFYDLKVSLNKGEEVHHIKAKNVNEYISNIISYYREQNPTKLKEIKESLAKANELKPSIGPDKGKIALFVGELNKATGAKLELSCFPYLKSFPIFNYSQLENVPELEIKTPSKAETLKRAEGLLIASGANIKHSDENFYNPTKHEINLKPMDSFKSPEAYYSTAIQQVAHWASIDEVPFHPDQKVQNEPDDLAFAREELSAELANIFISSELGLDYNVPDRPSHNAAYIELLNDDYQELFTAVTHANRIATHVLNSEKRLDLESEAAKNLQNDNPKLYKKIEAFKSQELDQEQTTEKSTKPKEKSSSKTVAKGSKTKAQESKEIYVKSDKEQLETKIFSRDNSNNLEQDLHQNKAYLEKFFEEKNLPLKEFVINYKGEDNFITNEVVIDYLINSNDSITQGKIKETLVKLDFKNGDIDHFLEHCAKGMVMQQEADRDIDALSNIDAREFKNHEIEHELKNERPVSSAKSENPMEDNDFSI